MDSIFHVSTFSFGGMSSEFCRGRRKEKRAAGRVSPLWLHRALRLPTLHGVSVGSVPVDALFLFTVIGLLRIALGTHPVAGKPKTKMH